MKGIKDIRKDWAESGKNSLR